MGINDILDFIIEYMNIILFGIIFISILFRIFIKKVPLGTVVIIDRKGHYLKTVKFGHYFFNPITDKITTQISTRSFSKTYTNIFETYDGQYLKITFLAKYKTHDIENTLKALSDNRRSIDDVINCSVYNVLKGLNSGDIQHKVQLKQLLQQKAAFDALSLSFILEDIYVNSIIDTQITSQDDLFKPHVSSGNSAIKYY